MSLCYVDQGATFDPERLFRFKLWRTWANGTTALWVMLNPSTADERVLDPTLRRVEGFTRAWGHAGFVVVNLFPLRSKDPDRLYDYLWPAGVFDENALVILDAVRESSVIVCGWGKERIAQNRGRQLATGLASRQLYCLGANADGSPKHPLYLAAKTPLVHWPVASRGEPDR